jgi:hypothetical protein
MKHFAAALALLLPFILSAQKISLAKGSNKLRIEKMWSEDFALNLCRENAKLNALESVFGTAVDQSNTMYVKNENISGKSNSSMAFYSISNTLVNGEWLETVKEEPPKFYDEDGFRWVEIVIEGKVRELIKIPFSPEVYTANCQAPSCSTEVFNSGASFYLNFIAPKNGYLSIFLDDGKTVQRLLPYSSNENDNSFLVKGDILYTFFSKTKENKNADEIELFTTHTMEQNRLFILYSPKEFEKPILKSDTREDKTGYLYPKNMDSIKFQEWLQKLRVYNKTIELKIIDITIKNTK